MLTVREAMAMPVFARARVVAGEGGLANEITWVHIVDIPDTHFQWRRQGILLLTAGFGMRNDPERQAALVPRLAELGFAGLVLCVGYYFDETPEAIRQHADELNFPVIETPPDLLFIDVTEAILEQIINRQYSLLQQSNEIHRQLTRLVLRGGNLYDLASTLARILDRSITIEDASFRVLAAAQNGPVDPARQRSVRNEQTTPEVAEHLLDEGIYARLLEHMAPMHVPPVPEMGMEMERFVAPIIVDREIYGYIWIIAGDHPLNELDELAIDHGATIAALILFKEESVRKAEETLRGGFFEQLLMGGDPTVLAEQAHRFHYRLDRPHQVFILDGSPEAGGSARSLMDDVERWFESRDRPRLLVWRGDQLVLVLESRNGAGQPLAEALVADLSHPARRLLVCIGTEAAPYQDEPASIRRSYEEAGEALRIGRALGRLEGVCLFEQLGLLHWLYHLPPERRAGNVYVKHVATLAAYDQEHQTELVKTLETYLDHGGALAEAAAALYIHRNTLLHRIERIQELCALDVRDPLHRLNLHVALKSHRLHR